MVFSLCPVSPFIGPKCRVVLSSSPNVERKRSENALTDDWSVKGKTAESSRHFREQEMQKNSAGEIKSLRAHYKPDTYNIHINIVAKSDSSFPSVKVYTYTLASLLNYVTVTFYSM